MTESRMVHVATSTIGVERRTRGVKGFDRDEREDDRCQPAGAEPAHERHGVGRSPAPRSEIATGTIRMTVRLSTA